jgi:hypothetical protein
MNSSAVFFLSLILILVLVTIVALTIILILENLKTTHGYGPARTRDTGGLKTFL